RPANPVAPRPIHQSGAGEPGSRGGRSPSRARGRDLRHAAASRGRRARRRTPPRSSRGPLPDHLARALVVAKPEVARVPEAAVARPLGEGELTDEPRLDPVRSSRDRIDVGERRVVALELAEAGP